MRRITSVIVTICILFMCCVTPVSATENANDVFLDLLDYSTPNGGDGYFVTYHEGEQISFDLPYKIPIGIIDGVIQVSGRSITGGRFYIASYEFELEVISLGNFYYRIIGYGSRYVYSNLKFEFDQGSSGDSNITFCSLSVASGLTSHFAETGSVAVITPHGETSAIMSSSAGLARAYMTGTTDYNQYETYSSYIYPDNWKKYDYMDLYIKTYTGTVDSVTCLFGDIYVPFEVSYLNGNSPGFNASLDGTSEYPVYNESTTDRWFVMRLDLRGLDRTSSKYPVVSITGSFYTGSENSYIALWAVNGFLDTSMVETDTFWYQRLWNTLKSGFQSVVDAIRGDTTPGDEFNAEVKEELNELDQMQAVMDSVTRPAIDSVNVSVDQYVSQADIAVLASPVMVFFEDDIFRSIIIMSILLATVSYVLYGKRG